VKHPHLRRRHLRALTCAVPVLAALISSAACGSPSVAEPTPVYSSLRLYPVNGPTNAPTPVTITGHSFRQDMTVLVDGIAATNVKFLSSTSIAAVFPAHAAGVVTVSVARPHQAPSPGMSTTFVYYDLATTPLLVFKDPVTGFSTSDLHDAQDEVVRFNTAGDLLWSDGTRFPGYAFDGAGIKAVELCSCWIEIRFGSRNGVRRAYLTGAYPHEGNPGTVLDLQFTQGNLISNTSHMPVSEPGPNVLSGVITEGSLTGAVPLAGVGVYFLVGDGWRTAQTDANGRFEIPWLHDDDLSVVFQKEGYRSITRQVSVRGHTHLEIQLVR
jgi:hypothetical protein